MQLAFPLATRVTIFIAATYFFFFEAKGTPLNFCSFFQVSSLNFDICHLYLVPKGFLNRVLHLYQNSTNIIIEKPLIIPLTLKDTLETLGIKSAMVMIPSTFL